MEDFRHEPHGPHFRRRKLDENDSLAALAARAILNRFDKGARRSVDRPQDGGSLHDLLDEAKEAPADDRIGSSPEHVEREDDDDQGKGRLEPLCARRSTISG